MKRNNFNEKDLNIFKNLLTDYLRFSNKKKDLTQEDIDAITKLVVNGVRNLSGGQRTSLASFLEEQLNVPKKTINDQLEDFLDGTVTVDVFVSDLVKARKIKNIINKSPYLKEVYDSNDHIFEHTYDKIPAVNLFMEYNGTLKASTTLGETIYSCAPGNLTFRESVSNFQSLATLTNEEFKDFTKPKAL